MLTYFVSDGPRVKIGKTKNFNQRFASLQSAQGIPLQVLLLLEGDLEKPLHEQFAVHRIRGEWFRLSHDILHFIAKSKGQKGIQVPFYTWLLDQKNRIDNVGKLALIVASDPLFPQSSKRLYRFLKHYEHNSQLRNVMKYAHFVWRGETGQLLRRTS